MTAARNGPTAAAIDAAAGQEASAPADRESVVVINVPEVSDEDPGAKAIEEDRARRDRDFGARSHAPAASRLLCPS